MSKHAYCIIAHSEPTILSTLVKMIDDSRNNIFILLDSKADKSLFANITTNQSHLEWVPDRVDVRWGDISQVRAEIMVLGYAFSKGYHQYYHLISGIDLPLKSQDYIHEFMSNNYPKEFVGFSPNKLQSRYNYYYLFTKYYRHNNILIFLVTKILRKAFIQLQKIVGFRRKYTMEIQRGCNWISITNEFCEYLLSYSDSFLKQFKYIPCVDEFFAQTILWNSPFKKNIYDLCSEFDSCMRMIDWNRGNPYVWGNIQEDDFNILINSNKLFARKFSSKNPQIIDQVCNHILSYTKK